MKETRYKLTLAQRLYHRKYMRQWRKDHPERAKEHYRTYWKKKREKKTAQGVN